MLLWQVTLIAFITTSVIGLYLFSGYTFRIKVHYPLVLVTCHVVAALVTAILFGFLVVHLIHTKSTVFAEVFSVISFVLVLLTLLSGLYFYFRFDARKKRATWALIITHLVMASLSFIFAVSSIATVAAPSHSHNTYPGDAWYRYHLKHQSK